MAKLIKKNGTQEKRKARDRAINRANWLTIQGSKARTYWERFTGKITNLGYMTAHPKTARRINRQIGPYNVRRRQLNDAKRQVIKLLKSKGIEVVGSNSRVKTTRSIARNLEEEMSVRGQIRPAINIMADAKRESRIIADRTLQEAIGIRIFVKTEEEARNAFEILKGLGGLVEAKNYAQAPRAGGYRAYHLITKSIEGNLEIQIRTPKWERQIATFDRSLRPYHKPGEKVRRTQLRDEFNRVMGIFQAKSGTLTQKFILRELKNSGLPLLSKIGVVETLAHRGRIDLSTETALIKTLRRSVRRAKAKAKAKPAPAKKASK